MTNIAAEPSEVATGEMMAAFPAADAPLGGPEGAAFKARKAAFRDLRFIANRAVPLRREDIIIFQMVMKLYLAGEAHFCAKGAEFEAVRASQNDIGPY